MVSPVISFRVGEEAIAQLRERAKPGESASQTAQRLLNELLGTTKEVGLEMTVVDSRIQSALVFAIAPLRDELENRLDSRIATLEEMVQDALATFNSSAAPLRSELEALRVELGECVA